MIMRPITFLVPALVLGCALPSPRVDEVSPADPPTPARAEAEPTEPTEASEELVVVGPGIREQGPADFDLGLSDREYWSDPQRTRAQVVAELRTLGRDVIAIDAPNFVDLDDQREIPLLLTIVAAPGAEHMKVEHAIVIAYDIDRRSPTIGIDAGDELPLAAPDPGQQMRAIQLRPFQTPATVLLTVLAGDQVSNRVLVEIGSSARDHHQAVERAIAAEADDERWSGEPRVFPPVGDPLPSYDRVDGSPEIPDAPGVVLAGPALVEARAGARAVIRGSFRLPVDPHDRVVDDPGASEGSGLDVAPTAMSSLTIAITLDDAVLYPPLFLTVPSWDPLPSSDPMATGYFAFDLFAGGIPAGEGNYYVYALADQLLTGPLPIRVVDGATPR